jgi:hypothetical protein
VLAHNFIPVLETPDSWMLHDTISIGPCSANDTLSLFVLLDTPLQRASAFILKIRSITGSAILHSYALVLRRKTSDWVGLRLAQTYFSIVDQ